MMRRDRLYPRLALGVCLVACSGELWALHRVRQQARRAVARLEAKMATARALAVMQPAPTSANVAAASAAIAEARANVELVGSEFSWPAVDEPAQEKYPTKADDFFARQKLIGTLHRRARAAGVLLGTDERLGLDRAVNPGARAAAGEEGARRAVMVERVVGELIAARPLAVNEVEWVEADVTKTHKSYPDSIKPAQGTTGNKPRRDSVLPADFLHVVFEGSTASLQTFMHEMSGGRGPVIIRAVEVEALERSPASPGDRTADRSARFSLWLELPREAGATEARL